MKTNRLTKSRTCVYNINYHIAWCVKYRKKILTGEIEIYLKHQLYQISKKHNFVIHAIECDKDHIHMFVSAHPKIPISQIVKLCKGTTSRNLFNRFPFLKTILWENTLWNPSFFVETIGSTSEENIKRYIQNQKTK